MACPKKYGITSMHYFFFFFSEVCRITIDFQRYIEVTGRPKEMSDLTCNACGEKQKSPSKAEPE